MTRTSPGWRTPLRPRDRRAALHERRLSVRHLTVPPALASDDFSVLARASGCPSVYWFVGSGEPGGGLGAVRPACHTDTYLPHPATLSVATAAMREAMAAALAGALTGPPDERSRPEPWDGTTGPKCPVGKNTTPETRT